MSRELRPERTYAPANRRPNYAARRLVALVVLFGLLAVGVWGLQQLRGNDVGTAGGLTGAGLAQPLLVEGTGTTAAPVPATTTYDPAARQAEIRDRIAPPTTAYDPTARQAEIRSRIAPPTTQAPATTAPPATSSRSSGSSSGSGSSSSGSSGSSSGSSGSSSSRSSSSGSSASQQQKQAPVTQAPKPTSPPQTQAPKPTSPPTTKPPATTAPPAPAPVAPPSANMSKSDVEALLRSMWPDDSEDKAVMIVRRESNFIPSAYNGWCCYGLFQIYFGANQRSLATLGVTSADQLLDPVTNINVALWMFQRSGWGPWGG